MTTGPAPSDVRAAADRLRGVIRHTPMQRWESVSAALGRDVQLKLECWQRTGSFKLRGAYNAVAALGHTERAAGLVTASAGNHGQAVALAARELGCAVRVFAPGSAPALKQQRIREFGAGLDVASSDYDEAEDRALRYAADTGAVFVHAFSDPHVVAGQGTVGLEILADMPAVDTVVVPVGGGGLAAGVGLVVRAALPAARIIGVQSDQTRAMYAAFRAGRVVDVPVPPTLADGLAGRTDDASYQRLAAVLDDVVLVTETDIAHAIRSLLATEGVLAEGAGAVGAAAVLSGRVPAGESTAIIISGGNIDTPRLGMILRQQP
jgi:threonine dehydratase